MRTRAVGERQGSASSVRTRLLPYTGWEAIGWMAAEDCQDVMFQRADCSVKNELCGERRLWQRKHTDGDGSDWRRTDPSPNSAKWLTT